MLPNKGIQNLHSTDAGLPTVRSLFKSIISCSLKVFIMYGLVLKQQLIINEISKISTGNNCTFSGPLH